MKPPAMPEPQKRVSRSRGHWLAVIGAWIQIVPVLGMIGTVIGMVRTFTSLTAHSGIGDPSQLSAIIGEVLIATFVGMLIALIGAIMLLVAVFSMRYRSPWLFCLLIVLGALYLLAFPLGTIIGVVFLVVALTKRQEFVPTLSNEVPTATP